MVNHRMKLFPPVSNDPSAAKIRDLADARRWPGMKDIRGVVRVLNPLLRGWGGYFRTGNASDNFSQLDAYVRMRLIRLLRRRGGQRSWRPGGRPSIQPLGLTVDSSPNTASIGCWGPSVILEACMPPEKTIGNRGRIRNAHRIRDIMAEVGAI